MNLQASSSLDDAPKSPQVVTPAVLGGDQPPARKTVDIISEGFGLQGEGQKSAAGLLKQREEKSRDKQRKGAKRAVGLRPLTMKHKGEVRKMIDGLRRDLARYARKHRLNLSQLGEVLEAYLRADGLTAWQAFLSLRGSARRGCEDISS
jgi:hypothetical protein